jgi:hypothetical protein
MTQTSDYKTSETSFISTYNRFTRFLVSSVTPIMLIHYFPKCYIFFSFLFLSMPFKTVYGISNRELTSFVEDSKLVRFWLRKFGSRSKEVGLAVVGVTKLGFCVGSSNGYGCRRTLICLPESFWRGIGS